MNTNIQQTSLETYWSIKPTLGKRQAVILAYLSDYTEGKTNNEIANGLGIPINQVTPRIFELRSKGLVCEYMRRACRITGRTAIVWKIYK